MRAGDMPEWFDVALCAQVDPDAHWPDKGGSVAAAMATCAACDVRAQCLAYALDNDERYGVWGGTTEMERRKIRRQAKRDLKAAS